jgi:cell division protein FtsA
MTNEYSLKDSDQVVFALDIGTRTVIGIVCIKENGILKVVASEILEHGSRSMMDGQVHDINKVAHTVEAVKEKLEQRLGITLKKVAIAAAGRVLKTVSVKVEIDIDSTTKITRELITSLELDGVQKAQTELNLNKDKSEILDFYCVGYTIINYYLNGYVITNPLDHKGKKLSADILATFLPQLVVDSLYAVTDKVGLEVISLTLEPIAAINVAIPEDLRLLNLALVDIGAGTSDIAITKNGSIVAYGMVPTAGDEITERIVQNYLVDFNTAENIKISMAEHDKIQFQDILGTNYDIDREEVEFSVKGAVENLASEIAEKILEFNEKAPNAVFCVGGGSMTRGLMEILADKLKLQPQRVAIRNRDTLKDIEFNEGVLNGPNVITVIGIAKTAQEQIGHDFIHVLVDGSPVRLFKSKNLQVGEALTITGFNAKNLVGKTGKPTIFTLNGARKVVKGKYGKAAEIYLNNNIASLDTDIKEGDAIVIKPAEDGSDSSVTIKDYVSNFEAKRIFLNGSFLDISTKVVLNGAEVKDLSMNIKNNDNIDIVNITTLEDLIKTIDINIEQMDVYINEKNESLKYVIKDGDKINFIPKKNKENYRDKVQDILKTEEEEKKNPNLYYSQEYSKPKKLEKSEEIEKVEKVEAKVLETESIDNILEGLEENKFPVYVNDKKILLESGRNYIFVDIFNYIDFNLNKPQGTIVLKLNSKNASYTDKLGMGDKIDIYWDKK